MRKNLRFLPLLFLFAAMIFVSCASSSKETRYVRIMLTDTEHVTVTSENPILVKAGEDAVFHVVLEDNYAITELSDGAVYEDGSVILKSAEYPTTISAVSKIPEYYWFEYRYSSKTGTLETSLPSDKYMEGTEITVKAIPADGAIFLGFTQNKSLEEGGELLSAVPEYTFRLRENTTIYPNYVSPGNFLLIYHANGGTVTGSDMDTLYSQSSAEYYLCPNTLQLKDFFERDGYVLLGYNTEADGSGRYYGCGWNVDTGDDLTEDLYCIWVKESPAEDFEYEVSKNTIRITGYNGSDEFVVIPEYIDGMPVARISKNALANCTFKSIYLTKNVEGFLGNSFKDCKNLESVYMTDMITAGDDTAFTGCDNFKTLYINGVLDPTFSYSEMGICSVKFERLLTADPNQKKLTVISGSSSLYGLSTPQLEEALDYEYNVINYGIHANTPCTFFMELVAAFTNPGDIVVNAPEPMSEQWGSNDFNMTFWQIYECAFGAISYVDISHFDKVFSSFSSFNNSRQKMQWGKTYDYYDPNYSNDGDLILNRPNYGEDYVTWVNGILDFSRNCHNTENVSNFNREVALLREKGAECLLSYCPININALTENSKTKDYQKKYQESAAKKYDSIIISDLTNYIMSGKHFYNTDMHPNTEGTKIRTAQLAADIKAYLNSETAD